MSSLSLGRVAGFSIRIHVSWVIILVLIDVTVAAEVVSRGPQVTPATAWGIGTAVALGFLISAVLHELAHAVVARRAGVPTEIVVVHFLGAAASPRLETTRPRDEVATALAGPIVSIALGLALLAVAVVADRIGSEVAAGIGTVALIVGTLDLALGLLNLVPAYPLDGGRVIRAVAWARTGDPQGALRTAATVGRWTGLVIAAVGVVAIVLVDSSDGLMIALGGWFLTSTARSMERRALLDGVLDGMTVREVMEPNLATIPPGLTLDTFAGQVLDGSAALAFPVVRGGDLLGLIGARQLRRVPRRRWPTARVEDVMVVPPTLPVHHPDDPVQGVLDDLARTGLDGLPVVEDGRLTGMVMRTAVAEAVRVRAEQAGILPR